MNQSSRTIQLSVFLVIILLGMTLSSALNSGDSNELKKEETAQQTHANVSTLFYPGSQGGSTYSYSTISASEDSTCAVAEDHSMRCWGRNNHLQLGTESTPTNTSLNEPKKVYLNSGGGSSSALEVSGYGEHTCALMSDGRMKCWGRDDRSQHGSNQTALLPEATWFTSSGALGSNSVVQVSSGRNHTCAILTDQSLWCWGDNNWGQLGRGFISNTPFWYPAKVTSGNPSNAKWIAVSAGAEHTCGILLNGTAYCWGWDTYWKLGWGGLGTTLAVPSYVAVLPQNRTVAAISAGSHNTCAILDDGTVRCWGLNNFGQSGDGTTTTRANDTDPATLTLLPQGSTAIAIDVGENHVCAILNDNRTFCWGLNTDGQLGIGSTIAYREYPTQVNTPQGVTFSTISTGFDHTCAISSDASAYCWGDNTHGELGDGTWVDSFSPSEINLGPTCDEDAFHDCTGLVDQDAQLGERDPDDDDILSIFDPSPFIPNCAPGYYSISNTSGCIAANPGYYSASDLGYQIPCPAGTYQPNSGQSSCLVVDPGYYADVNSSAVYQLPCPAGTYNPNSGQYGEVCIEVEPGNYSAAGSTQPMPCSAGTYQPLAGQGTCIPANPGHFVQLSMQTQQEECPPGTYQPIPGQPYCFSASEGHYTAEFGSTDQTQCGVGTYSPSAGNSHCLTADRGHYVSTVGANEQVPCEPGFYQDSRGMTSCIANNPGFYTDESGSSHAIPCPAGTYQPDSQADECIETDTGFFAPGPGNSSQTECGAGSYAPMMGMGQCTLAEAGHYVRDSGSSNQEECPVGTHQPSAGQSACTENDPGHYTVGEGSKEQIACDPGTYQDSASATSCIEADYGYYVPESASSEQMACLAGTYQPSTGQSGCIDAEKGRYVPGTAATESMICVRGTYQPEEGQAECLVAQPGNIAPNEGMEAQIPCDRGTYQDLSAQTECITADPGHYVPAKGATSQTPCKPGSYQPSAGMMACNLADSGHFVSESGATSQTKCPEGQSQADRGMTSCEDDDSGLPTFAIIGAVVVLAIAAVFIQFMNNSKSPPRRGKRRPPKGKRKVRRPPQNLSRELPQEEE